MSRDGHAHTRHFPLPEPSPVSSSSKERGSNQSPTPSSLENGSLISQAASEDQAAWDSGSPSPSIPARPGPGCREMSFTAPNDF
eukprot:364416-Chlamydomonas_euryale.AAC.21